MHHLTNTSSRSLRRAAVKATKPSLARGAHKEIKFSNEGRASILKGVDVLAKAVSVTLGPKGRSSLPQRLITCNDSLSRTQCHHRAVVWQPQNHQGYFVSIMPCT